MTTKITENRNTKEITSARYTVICDMLQIPSGIGVLIPDGYFGEIRPKSSNFLNGYSVEIGTIDMNYTYGMGVQIQKLPNRGKIELEAGQKIAQFILVKANPVIEIECLDKKDFESLEEVNIKRKTRTGGFGSTGKF